MLQTQQNQKRQSVMNGFDSLEKTAYQMPNNNNNSSRDTELFEFEVDSEFETKTEIITNDSDWTEDESDNKTQPIDIYSIEEDIYHTFESQSWNISSKRHHLTSPMNSCKRITPLNHYDSALGRNNYFNDEPSKRDKFFTIESEFVVHSKYELLVSGFIRIDSERYYIPNLVVRLCVSYYWFPEDIADYAKLKITDKQSAILSQNTTHMKLYLDKTIQGKYINMESELVTTSKNAHTLHSAREHTVEDGFDDIINQKNKKNDNLQTISRSKKRRERRKKLKKAKKERENKEKKQTTTITNWNTTGLYLDQKNQGKYFKMESEFVVNSKYQVLVSGFIRINSEIYYVPQSVVQLCASYYWFPEGITDYVQLKLTDNSYYLLDKQSATLSEIISQAKAVCDYQSQLACVDLKAKDNETFELVLEYLCHHNGVKPEAIAKPIRSVKMERIVADKWDAQFMNSLTKKQVFQVILMSNNLNISGLVHLGCAKIATLIKGKSPEEIKNILADDSCDAKQE